MKWITNQKEMGDDVEIVSWIHSHVGGTTCYLSSIDMHTQFRLEEGYPSILGTVFQINEKNECVKFDFYKLTGEGRKAVTSCNRSKRNLHNIQHPGCHEPYFYGSHLDDVSIVDTLPIELTNISNVWPNEPFEDDTGDLEECKGCNS